MDGFAWRSPKIKASSSSSSYLSSIDRFIPSSSHNGFAFLDALSACSLSMFSLSRTFSSTISSSSIISFPESSRIPLSANVRIISPSVSNASRECPLTFAFFNNSSSPSSISFDSTLWRLLGFSRIVSFLFLCIQASISSSLISSPTSPRVACFSSLAFLAFSTRARSSSPEPPSLVSFAIHSLFS